MNITVLGASGMLGSMLVDYLSSRFTVIATVRDMRNINCALPVVWKRFQVRDSLEPVIREADVIINAIGVTGKRGSEKMLEVNSQFPVDLAIAAEERPVIQIATDCIYSGSLGHYDENCKGDAKDKYGLSKRIGEVKFPNVYNLRCSIVGPEPYPYPVSLLGWFLSHKKGATVNGYTNHYWNGVTTLHFAKLCEAAINYFEDGKGKLPNTQHIVPSGQVSKYELLCLFARYFKRKDIHIAPYEMPDKVDRTLATMRPYVNCGLWTMAGYEVPPTISEMVKELAEYME